MELPDDLLLSKVQPANVHYDKKSLERTVRHRQILNPKYKLAGNTIKPFALFIFFVLTTTKDACRRNLSICISQADWEEKVPNCLNEKYSYTDLTKSEVMEKYEILAKMKDRKNGFKRVAKLCEKKYEELQNLLPRMREAPRRLSEKEMIIADMALSLSKSTSEIAEEVLKKLRLD
jgi:hypothetical protein